MAADDGLCTMRQVERLSGLEKRDSMHQTLEFPGYFLVTLASETRAPSFAAESPDSG